MAQFVVLVGAMVHTLPEGNAVYGVTSLDDLLYVLRDKASQQITVYDVNSFRLHRRLNVPDLDLMVDIVACAYNQCLYVCGDMRIHRVALYDDVVSDWPVDDVCYSLSVTDTHTLLVTCDKAQKIKEFSTDGRPIREIQLAQDVVSPFHAVKLSSGQFVVCHGRFFDPVQRVCLVSSDGQVVKSFGGAKGTGSQQMYTPVHIAVDRNGFVFVADLNNRRVLLLSPSLSFVREVVSHEQLKWAPLRLWLDEDSRRLYIAVNKWGDLNDTYVAGRVIVIQI